MSVGLLHLLLQTHQKSGSVVIDICWLQLLSRSHPFRLGRNYDSLDPQFSLNQFADALTVHGHWFKKWF